MSDTNRVSLAYDQETAYGIKDTTPTLQDLRITGETLKQETQSQDSEEIRSDRQISDHFRTGVSVTGDINMEASYGNADEILKAVLCSAGWSAIVVVDAADVAISAADSDNSFNHTTAWAINPSANQWIEVRGFATNPVNNGFFKVVSVTGTKIVVSGATLITEAASAAITITQGAQIINGVADSFYSYERTYADLATEFSVFIGIMFNTFALSIPQAGAVTMTAGVIGKTEESGSTTFGDGSNTAAPTNSVMNTVDDVLSVLEAQASMAITALDLSINNNLRARQVVGTLGTESVGKGSVQVTGSFTLYFQTSALYDKYLNYTNTSLAIVLEDSDGNAYVIDMPNLKINDGQRVAGTKDSDVMGEFTFAAFMEPTELTTIRIARFAA